MGNTIESSQELYRAYEFAKKKHEGQVRKFSGEPYVNHPKRVADILMNVSEQCKTTISSDVAVAALLHDTIEDTDCTKEELSLLFGESVATMVLAITNDKEEIVKIGKTEYLVKKVNGLDSDQLLIKLADRFDNVSDAVTPENAPWFKSYSKQTREVFFNSFVNHDAMGPMHIKIKTAIMEKLKRGEEMVENFEKQNDNGDNSLGL